MRRHRMPEVKEGNVNVTPLIDIVMCLIIFFMLVAKIGVDTGAEAMDLPTSVQGITLDDMGNTLTINVFPGEDGATEPIVTALSEGKKREFKLLEPESGRRPLKEALELARFGRDGKRNSEDDNPNVKVILRGEQDLEYRFLEPVLITVADSGITQVNFNTKKAERVAGQGG